MAKLMPIVQRHPTNEVMPYSTAQIWDMSADKLANIEATKDQWERRGNACHHALEALLTGEPFRQDDLDEFDKWINPLFDHAFGKISSLWPLSIGWWI